MAAGDGSLVTFSVSDGLLELAEIKSQGKEVPGLGSDDDVGFLWVYSKVQGGI